MRFALDLLLCGLEFLLCVSRRNGSRACNLNFVACLRLTTERKAKNQEVLASHNHEFVCLNILCVHDDFFVG